MNSSASSNTSPRGGPPTDHIGWGADGGVRYLDQTRLLGEEVYRETEDIDAMVEAIKMLRVRGAPLIGVSAAMGLAAAAAAEARSEHLTLEWFEGAAHRLAEARPTAVNLGWAIDRMRTTGRGAFAQDTGTHQVVAALRDESQAIWDEDIAMCAAIGAAGAALVPPSATVLTHCNAGALATGGMGTALAVIYHAHGEGKNPRVLSTETRPLRQGARLTVWELHRAGIPVTAIVDSAAAACMAEGNIDCVITGADRIAANGDVANKIGTYGLAVLARAHQIPFYVAAPFSTFDLSLTTGEAIPIEERAGEEVDAAPGVAVRNPAFDVTPADLVDALITDRGVLRPPYTQALSQVND
jgi:methylthioribose-1-phosphate isomerase